MDQYPVLDFLPGCHRHEPKMRGINLDIDGLITFQQSNQLTPSMIDRDMQI
jgi:hypothetical protein